VCAHLRVGSYLVYLSTLAVNVSDDLCQMMLKHFFASGVFLECSRSSFPVLKGFLALVCMHVFRGNMRMLC